MIGEKESSPLIDQVEIYPRRSWHKKRDSALYISGIICFMALAALFTFSLFTGSQQSSPMAASSIPEAVKTILKTTPLIGWSKPVPLTYFLVY